MTNAFPGRGEGRSAGEPQSRDTAEAGRSIAHAQPVNQVAVELLGDDVNCCADGLCFLPAHAAAQVWPPAEDRHESESRGREWPPPHFEAGE